MIKLVQIFILAQMVIEPQHIPIERGNNNFLIADAIHADPFQESLPLLGGCGKFQCFTHKLALAVLSGVGNVGFKPVSYTHLDVYKRQVMLGILGNSFEHFGNKGQYHIFIDTVLCRAELSNWDFAVLGTGCLLYTSRCV